MANTGWDPVRAEYKKNNLDLIQKMNQHEREKVVPEEHERDVIRTHERTCGEADCKYLDTLTCAAIGRHQENQETGDSGGREEGEQPAPADEPGTAC